MASPSDAGSAAIVTPRAVLRPATMQDVPLLTAMAADPTVRAWWGVMDDDDWRGDLGEATGGHFVIECNATPVGLVQWYEETDPMYRHAGIDIFLVGGAQGRGLGAEAVDAVVRWLVREHGHRRLVIDPAAANERAIACYERVGFRPVGIARAPERGPDGTWHDQLLMDLLADDLTDVVAGT